MKEEKDKKILGIISRELSNSTGGTSSIDKNRRNALKYYLGDKGETSTGKSSVVSTDIADAIEWIMPEVMKAFTQNNEVVTFDPISSDDRRQAELESRFVYDVLMKDNEGFITLYEFFKDALLQKNGYLKAYYEDRSQVHKESYTGLNQLELEVLQQDPDLKITGLSQRDEGGFPVFDINVTRTNKNGSVIVRSVAPENFRISRMHNSVSVKDARFCAETMYKTKSELLEDGFDPKIIEELPTEVENSNHSYRFSEQGQDTTGFFDSGDESQTVYEVTECYIHMDIDDDGIAERCKITVAGFDNPTHILEIEEVDAWPYISASAIIMPHTHFGMSIYDRLKEIQDQKTSLWRNILDNMYLQNNQRTIVQENMVNLDDLLVSRAGGIIRVKSMQAIQPIVTPPIGGDAAKMMDYLDQVRAGRVGVSPEGNISDTAVGDSVGSQGIERIMSQKEELVGLMVRVFAETGVKPLCERIRTLLINHVDSSSAYEFHGEWVEVVPADWKSRYRTSVRVGTGTGNRKEQAAAISQIIAIQEKVLAQPGQSLVTEAQVFAAINDFAKLNGMPGCGAYLLDPASPEGERNKQSVSQSMRQQQEQEMREKELLAQTQIKIANAEESKARTAEQNVQLQYQIQMQKMQIEHLSNQAQTEIQMLQQQIAELKEQANMQYKQGELEFRYYDSNQRAAVERERIQAASKQRSKDA